MSLQSTNTSMGNPPEGDLLTTGEVAKLCGITVRTVQYYDTRNVVSPSVLSEGGRRLYSPADVQRMRIACYLRSMDVPVDAISTLFAEDDPGRVIDTLVEERRRVLQAEADEAQDKLRRLNEFERSLRTVNAFSIESIGDIARMNESYKELHRIRAVQLAVGIPLDILELAALIYWIVTGVWWPFVAVLAAMIPPAILLSRFYFKRVDYLCPECHTVFRPNFKEAFFANHTPTMRKLTCPHCNHKGFCIETAHTEG